jgi:hypothetical protein
VSEDAPPIVERSPLEGGHGNVAGIEHGMGFIVFLKDRRLSMIEGYCNGPVSTEEIDFSQAIFTLMRW